MPTAVRQLLLFGFLICFLALLIQARDVPAINDVCARLPNLALCRPNSSPPPVVVEAPPVESKPLDKSQYCAQYLPHYKYYCGGGTTVVANGDVAQAVNFCPGYAATCDVQVPQQQPVVVQQPPAQDYTQLCNEYRQTVTASCNTALVNDPRTKASCDLYTQYCGAIPTYLGDARCAPYQPTFELYCVRQPVTVQVVQFCQSYVAYCSDFRGPLVGVPAATAASPAVVPAQPQQNLPAASQLTPQNVSPEQATQLCTQYKSLALQNCKGNEGGQIRQYCDLYRQYCINQ